MSTYAEAVPAHEFGDSSEQSSTHKDWACQPWQHKLAYVFQGVSISKPALLGSKGRSTYRDVSGGLHLWRVRADFTHP